MNTLNVNGLAAMLGVNRATVYEWLNSGCPGEKVGRDWKLVASDVFDWRVARERTNTLAEITNVDVKEMQNRQLAATTLKIEAESALVTGDAVSLADVEATWAAIVGSARGRLLGVGSKLGPELALLDDPAACQDIVDTAIREATEELSLDVQIDAERGSEATRGEAENIATVGAAAQADGKRMGRRRTPPKS